MAILNDAQIAALAEDGMIYPFVATSRRGPKDARVISYGLSSFGYDIRCADEWKVFTDVLGGPIVDPKAVDERAFLELTAPEILIPPNGFVLARSYEYVRIPDDVHVIATGKSTYARCGIIANVTPLEAGWHGHITLEFSNTTPLPVKMYAFEGCVQLMFFEGERPNVTYSDRGGKYQGQTGVTLPKM